ncbi:hypothetical protein Ssi02_46700 [Sinosporangium siamense]|uniref:Uncharacterized protein n=1 Tax=Sinosporangium siamense TaxID=1367973 RepID=A0A919RL69_9ACTN|nr:hypothetical protein Ssi02_46700 [Sinosporangium siamense]
MHYLTLLILWEMRYDGNYQKFIPPNRWFGEVAPVPWAVPRPASGFTGKRRAPRAPFHLHTVSD